MREIRFRGRTAKGNWAYGHFFINEDNEPTILSRFAGKYVVDPKTIGQFIEIEDSKNVPIFEGDLVKCWDEDAFGADGVFEVVYCGANGYPAFDLRGKAGLCEWNSISHYKAVGRMIVIGNIHDNSMKTYEEVANAVGLEGLTRKRYLAYMKARWEGTEELKCQSGYAKEWAFRFLNGREYECSDNQGIIVLEFIDKEKE